MTRCEDGCRDKTTCFLVNQYFKCDHYQCIRTCIEIDRCIYCGNNKKRFEKKDIREDGSNKRKRMNTN